MPTTPTTVLGEYGLTGRGYFVKKIHSNWRRITKDEQRSMPPGTRSYLLETQSETKTIATRIEELAYSIQKKLDQEERPSSSNIPPFKVLSPYTTISFPLALFNVTG
jgi:hypothetical protein